MLKKLMLCLMVLGCFACASTEQKKDENFLGDFDAVSLERVLGAVVGRFKGDLSPREISFVFAPKTNMVSFHHKYMGNNIWITLTPENRTEFIAAINKYLETYKSSLTKSDSKTKAFFGSTSSSLKWGVLGVTHGTTAKLRFEYQLFGLKNLPYFIVASESKAAKDGNAYSPAIRLALSPAKCQEVLLRLDQHNLEAIVADLQAEFEEYETGNRLVKDIEQESTETDDTIEADESDFDF